MAFDGVKAFEGRPYSGMRVGGEHRWIYPGGRWSERKVAPDRWEFAFDSLKERETSAPAGSGATVGTEYHWYLLAHQWVRKLDADAYATHMEGMKHKVAHKRAHWRRWNCEYPDQVPERDRLVAILEESLAQIRREEPGPPPRPRIAEARSYTTSAVVSVYPPPPEPRATSM